MGRRNKFQHVEDGGIFAAPVLALEQLPVEFDERLRSTAAERDVRGRDAGRRWTRHQSAPDGVVGKKVERS